MMKHVCLTSPLARASKVFALALLLSLAIAPVAHAADEKPAAKAAAKPAAAAAPVDHMGKIAVVDTQFLVSNSKAGKSIRAQLDKQRNSYKGQIEKQEADLRAQEKKLAEQQGKLTKEQFMAERKKFQEKVIAAQKNVQQRRVAFDKAYATAMGKLREQVVKIVADLSGKRGVSLVMARQDLVLVDARLDMTNDVLKALDAKVSSIPVSVN
jgi:outer membrane protein